MKFTLLMMAAAAGLFSDITAVNPPCNLDPKLDTRASGAIKVGYTDIHCCERGAGLMRFDRRWYRLELCDGRQWREVMLRNIKPPYGSPANPGSSCADIYSRRREPYGAKPRDGVYWVRVSVQGFTCKGKANGFYVNPEDCGSYYRCIGGRKYHFKCPSKLWFNIKTNRCDWPRNVRCVPRPAQKGRPFPVYCDMRNGGYTMVFKAVGGVPKNAAILWQSAKTSAEFTTAALDVSNTHKNHYKNRLALPHYWKGFKARKARVVLYKSGKPVKTLTFNTVRSSNQNWFSYSRLLTSPWVDLGIEPRNFFSIVGGCHPAYPKCRGFMINRNYGGCPKDAGWMVLTIPDCAWEKRNPYTSILYSKLNRYTNWNTYANVGVADTMVVFIR